MKLNARTLSLACSLLLVTGYQVLVHFRHNATLTVCDAEAITTKWKNGHVSFLRRPLDFSVSGDDVRIEPVRLGEALQHFRSVQEVALSRVDLDWLNPFLEAWRDQSSVTDLYVLYSPMTDVQFGRLSMPNVRTAMLKDLEITGHTCPPFPNLTHLELEGLPVSDQGLARIANQCPSIETVILINTDVSISGLKSSGLFRLGRIRSILLDDPDYSAAELKLLRAHLKIAVPHIQL